MLAFRSVSFLRGLSPHRVALRWGGAVTHSTWVIDARRAAPYARQVRFRATPYARRCGSVRPSLLVSSRSSYLCLRAGVTMTRRRTLPPKRRRLRHRSRPRPFPARLFGRHMGGRVIGSQVHTRRHVRGGCRQAHSRTASSSRAPSASSGSRIRFVADELGPRGSSRQEWEWEIALSREWHARRREPSRGLPNSGWNTLVAREVGQTT